MEYDIEIQQLPGKANGRADALSRRPDYNTGANNNRDVIVLPLPDHVFVRAAQVLGVTPTQDKAMSLPWIDPHKLKRIDNLWHKEGCLVITGNLKDKRAIIQRHHDAPAYGHPGINNENKITERAAARNDSCSIPTHLG